MIIYKTTQPHSLIDSDSLKVIMLMTIALFLICAPVPDSSVISEMTSNFIVVAMNPALEP